jgi:hypothetical protein
MKTSTFFLLVAALTFGMPPSNALAQDSAGEARPPPPSGRLFHLNQVPRYLVTYFNSQTASVGLRSASIVSITNQSSVSCRVFVDWKLEDGQLECGDELSIGPGVEVDFCTRAIPTAITKCNSICSPNLIFSEGYAIVGSTKAGCKKIAVSSRTVYTAYPADIPVFGITDAKVVRSGSGNIGD